MMQGSYVEFSFIEKLHARITEVSPANPGETLNDAVERLIAERDDLREEVALLKRRMCCCCLEVTNDNVLCEVCYEDRIA